MAVVSLRSARHRTAALHSLFRRRQRTAVQRVRGQGNKKRHHHEQLENFSHQPNVLAPRVAVNTGKVLINPAGSNGRCNTIWYKAVFKGGVYETRETVW
ncbi:MAG: hypothetical protein WBY69_15530, partial [Candidatus Acidiferrales bacterium]